MIKRVLYFSMLIILARFILSFLLEYISLGGGSDANYYDSYALGISEGSTSTWPVFLRLLNDYGLYSRDLVAAVLFLFSIILIPLLNYALISGYGSSSRYKNYAVYVVLLYPTIIIYASDIYRDVAMYALFLASAVAIKKYYSGSFLYLILFSIITFILFGLRPYLGVSVLLALVVALLYRYFNPRPLFIFLIYMLSLLIFKESGLFNSLFEYRGESGFEEGGTSLGIGLLDSNVLSFTYLFAFSFLAQVFGLFFVNISSVIVFFAESALFIYAFIFTIKNIRHSDKLCSFLICFFIIYTTIWVLGNDNLGTAVRLRVPSYLAIIACWLIIKQKKNMLLTISAQKAQT